MYKIKLFMTILFFCYRLVFCAVNQLCGIDEMHVECYHCGPNKCQELGYPITCRGAMGVCRSQCICVDGYVRDAQRKCIPKNECPSCGGDRNATSGCGNHCGNRCSDYKNVNKTCWTGCRYNNCDCRVGYVYHDKLGVCVHPVDCSLEIQVKGGVTTSFLGCNALVTFLLCYGCYLTVMEMYTM